MNQMEIGQRNYNQPMTIPAPSVGKNGPTETDLQELQATFMRNVSHELRTPLAIIQGYAELLHEGDLGDLAPQQQRALFAIVDRTHQLQTLVEQIGVLMAIQSGNSLDSPFDLSEVTAQAVTERRSAAAEAGLDLTFDSEPGPALVSGDVNHVQQAVGCLLDNAIKFTPQGGQVEVRLYHEPDWVCLDVQDTGIGMDQETMQRMFQPFYQQDGSTTRRYGGLGLGLSVVQAVVEEHDAQLQVESQVGQGSRFSLRFPASSAAPQGEQAPRADSTRRILIVDDEKVVAQTLRSALKKLPNCEIMVTDSGEQALQLFEVRPFHLLITDYKMAGMDGLTLANRIRKLYPQTIIIIVTAYSSDDLLESAARASINRVLDKPLEIEEIRRATLEALGGA